MSSQTPRTPGPRRRIAGERRVRVEPSDRTAGTGPSTGTGPGPSAGPGTRTGTGRAGGTAPLPVADPDDTVRRRPAPSWRVVAVVGVLAAVLVALAAVLGLSTWSWSRVRDLDAAQEASRTAPAAAERAAAAVLSYDYRSLGADEKAAARYLTPAFRKKYLSSMALVRPNAPKLKAKVAASVKASGVSNADPDRVDVLVYVDQTTSSTANGGQPQLALNRAKFSMVRRDGAWLVDDITSY
jgi:Mce-associated membrane protein